MKDESRTCLIHPSSFIPHPSRYVVAAAAPAAGEDRGSGAAPPRFAARIGFLRIVRNASTGGTAMRSATELAGRHCRPCEGGVPPLSDEQVREYLAALPDWKLSDDGKR